MIDKNQTAISIEGIGKRYRLGRARSYKTLRETISGAFRGRKSRTGSAVNNNAGIAVNDNTGIPVNDNSGDDPHFWALSDVSLEVAKGESLGIIGRNGAGKSTLLKILSRITEPTTGRVEIRGRVGSLLEVGTGFHSELTGRENVFMNGVILGMRRHEVARNFDAIVDFAGVDQFLDTPVKHYSSGMYMRLAFSVAAHLQPEVLIVDEVLAVGDAEFQKKCLGKMSEVASEGRTVLFVSHNMGAVNRLCSRALLLESGRVARIGHTYEVTSDYLKSDAGTTAERSWDDPKTSPGDDTARLKSVRVLVNGQVAENVDIRYPVTVELEYWNRKPDAKLISAVTLFNDDGVLLFASADFEPSDWGQRPRRVGLIRSTCVIPGNLLTEGRLRVVAEVSTGHPVLQIHVLEYDAAAFQVVDKGEPGSVRGGWGRPLPGVIRPVLAWQTEELGETPPAGGR